MKKTPLTAPSFAFATIGENEFKVKIFGENLESFQLPIEKKKRTNRKRIRFGRTLQKSKRNKDHGKKIKVLLYLLLYLLSQKKQTLCLLFQATNLPTTQNVGKNIKRN